VCVCACMRACERARFLFVCLFGKMFSDGLACRLDVFLTKERTFHKS